MEQEVLSIIAKPLSYPLSADEIMKLLLSHEATAHLMVLINVGHETGTAMSFKLSCLSFSVHRATEFQS